MLQRCVGALMFLFLPVSVQAQQSISEFRVILDPNPVATVDREPKLGPPHAEIYGLAGNGSPDAAGLRSSLDVAGSAGGSIGNQRNHYFFSFDRQAFDWSRLLPGLPANESLLSALGNRSAQARTSGRSLIMSQALGRVDHRFTSRDAIDVRFDHSRISSKNYPSAFNGEQQTATIDNAMEISPTTANETRGQVTAITMQLPAEARALGLQSDFPTRRRWNTYEVADNLDHQVGRQDLRAGGSFLYDQAAVSFLQGDAGTSSFRESSKDAAFYIQDRWKLGSDLGVTAGLRYDLSTFGGIRTGANRLAPLLGFTWAPGGSRTSVLRGGYGVAYQQISLPALLGDPHFETIHLSGNSAPIGALVGFATPDSVTQYAYAEHANLEFEHQFGKTGTLLASYEHVRGVKVPIRLNQVDAIAAARITSLYDDLTIAFVQHPVSWGDYKLAYSYADGTAPQSQRWEDSSADEIRRASFTGTLHSPLSTGSGIWEQITHSIALTGYGNYTRRNHLAGVDFVHLNARLSKEVQLSSHARLEVFLQRSRLLQHRAQSIAKALAQAGSEGEMMGTGMQLGLRIRF